MDIMDFIDFMDGILWRAIRRKEEQRKRKMFKFHKFIIE